MDFLYWQRISATMTRNATRFIIVSAKPVYEKNAAKVSVCFELPHESGTLV